MKTPDPTLQRKYIKYDKGENNVLQAKELPVQVQATQGQDVLPIVREVLRSSGQPLDPATRAFMEPRFGYDFSSVRVHSGPAAEQSARDVNAHAYTVGSNIVFNEAQFSPETHRGRRLIAHELAHVVQQSGVNGICAGEGNEKRDLSPITPDILVARRPVNNISRVPVTQIQREEISTDDTKLRDESLGIGESIVIESLATGATAGMPSLKPVIKGGFTGFYTEIRHQIKEGKGQQFMDRVKKLLVNPGDMVAYGKGYFWGILQGLWSPVQGIVDIVKLAWKIQQWQIQNIASVIKNFHEIATMQGSLIDRFLKLGGKAKAFFERFKNNATEFVGRLMGAISGGIVELAKTGGRKAGQAIFRFLEKTWGEIGEGVGIVVGTVLVEVGLALVSGGVGNALTKVGQALDKVAPTLMKGVRFIASELGAIIAEIRSVVETIKAGLAKMGRSLLKGFEDFISEVGSIFDDLIAMLKKLFSSAEDAAAKLPIDVPLPIKKPVPHISAPRPPVSARPPHVEPVPAKKPHTESLVPKEPNVEVGAPKKPQVEIAPPKEPLDVKLQGDAIKFVNENPQVIKGKPGHRRASVGGGHEIVEVPDPSLPSGIGCELHSSTSAKIPCQGVMGTKGTETISGPVHQKGRIVKDPSGQRVSTKGKRKSATISTGEGGLIARVKKPIKYPGKKELEMLRSEFEAKRKMWLKKMAEDPQVIEFFGENSEKIQAMRKGLVPKGYEVHHNYSLAAGGKNVESNFTLIMDEVHKRVTSEFNDAVKQGLKEFEFPFFDRFVGGVGERFGESTLEGTAAKILKETLD